MYGFMPGNFIFILYSFINFLWYFPLNRINNDYSLYVLKGLHIAIDIFTILFLLIMIINWIRFLGKNPNYALNVLVLALLPVAYMGIGLFYNLAFIIMGLPSVRFYGFIYEIPIYIFGFLILSLGNLIYYRKRKFLFIDQHDINEPSYKTVEKEEKGIKEQSHDLNNAINNIVRHEEPVDVNYCKEIRYCRKCGTSINSDDVQFCRKCGNRLKIN
jgi:hypothetical protein